MEQTLNKAMKRMKEAMALACVLTMVVQSGLAQGELELDLQGVFVPQHQVKNYLQARSGGGALAMPLTILATFSFLSALLAVSAVLPRVGKAPPVVYRDGKDHSNILFFGRSWMEVVGPKQFRRSIFPNRRGRPTKPVSESNRAILCEGLLVEHRDNLARRRSRCKLPVSKNKPVRCLTFKLW